MRIKVIILLLLVSGCATDMRQVDREICSNQPPAYNQGYADGCNSGFVAAGHPYYKFSKDVVRFSSDVMYKQGWEDGFNICKGKY